MKPTHRPFKIVTIFSCTICLCVLLAANCASSSISENQVLAQSSQINSPAGRQSTTEILNSVGNPCRYNTPGMDITPDPASPDSRLYELVNAGFPREISLDEVVVVFNKFASCDERSKSQPPLTVEEIVAAIRDWDCTKEKSAINKKLCADIWKIAETGKMPKGSLIGFDCGPGRMCSNHGSKGYDVKTWEIYLYVWLDKYRRDMRDEPVYSHLIRLNYISSESRKNQ